MKASASNAGTSYCVLDGADEGAGETLGLAVGEDETLGALESEGAALG